MLLLVGLFQEVYSFNALFGLNYNYTHFDQYDKWPPIEFCAHTENLFACLLTCIEGMIVVDKRRISETLL